jgi:hypothetical protein
MSFFEKGSGLKNFNKQPALSKINCAARRVGTTAISKYKPLTKTWQQTFAFNPRNA